MIIRDFRWYSKVRVIFLVHQNCIGKKTVILDTSRYLSSVEKDWRIIMNFAFLEIFDLHVQWWISKYNFSLEYWSRAAWVIISFLIKCLPEILDMIETLLHCYVTDQNHTVLAWSCAGHVTTLCVSIAGKKAMDHSR